MKTKDGDQLSRWRLYTVSIVYKTTTQDKQVLKQHILHNSDIITWDKITYRNVETSLLHFFSIWQKVW